MYGTPYFGRQFFPDSYFGKHGAALQPPQVIIAHISVERASMCAIDVRAASTARIDVERASIATVSIEP